LLATAVLLPLLTGSAVLPGNAAGFVPIALPTFQGCRAHLSSSGTNLAVPVRIVRNAAAGVIIVAGVCVDGHGPFSFLVDTGASTTAIDSRVAALLHLRALGTVPLSGFGCQNTASFAKVSALSVDGLSLEPQVVLVGPLRSPLVPALAGLLGSDVLSRFKAVRIDFRAATLSLAGPEQPLSGSTAYGQRRPHLNAFLTHGTTTTISAVSATDLAPVPGNSSFEFSEARIMVMVRVGDHDPNPFVVDTGAGTTVISPSVASQGHLVPSGTISRGYAGLACPVRISHYRMGAWGLSALTAANRFSQFPLAPQTVSGNILFPGVPGLLGAGTISHYSPVVVDYHDGDLLLGPFSHP
jgi:predicted aspartyl protease